ncbi:MAG TPA: IS1 family transposase [Anaerolineales bacterium]
MRSTSRAGVETRGKETQKAIILKAYQERISLRGLERVFEVARQSISRWIIEHVKDLPELKDTVLPAEPGDVLEYDEAWSFVLKKTNQYGLWTVMCRRTRQIIAFVIGDRSEATCCRLWNKVPMEYRGCLSYSGFWDAYQLVFPVETHHCVGKGSGQTNPMERWYCTLRQSCARCVRKTLSFSKSNAMHEIVTRLFIIHHNLSLAT